MDVLISKKGIAFGAAQACFWTILFLIFCITFWYGIKLYQDENLPVGKIVPVFFGVMIGALSIGSAFPYMETISKGRGAADNIFNVIDSKPSIDCSSDSGQKPPVEGTIEFKDVEFQYPSRADVQVLKKLNLKVPKGKVVALVGSSGSGKSTVVQLVQRFYDPTAGQVLLDGTDIKELNVKYLREQIGVVSQEPVLFATSIEENIRYGLLEAGKEDIIQAAKNANAHDFIQKLPQGYQTLVGERGAQLSGGQKQRVAIARALIRNPKILLLDEATSALDHESEAVVQNALEKAGAGRTTIVIAHRLSTVKNADMIAVVSDGEVKELGSHNDLMDKQGLYHHLVKVQTEAGKDTEEGNTEMSERPESADSFRRTPSLVKSLKSVTSQDERRKDSEEDEETKIPTVKLQRIIKLNSPEWLYILIGSITSFISGLNHPTFAFVLTEYIRIFAMDDKPEQSKQSILLSCIFAGVAVFMFFVRIIQIYCLTFSGARLTSRIRKLVFRAFLKQDMEFYDQPENQVGTLTTKLASDTTLVQGATGTKIGTVIENITTLVVALVLGFVYGWKLSLVILSFLPILIGAGIIQGRMATGFNKNDSKNLDVAGKICSESIDNIRTVAGLTREDIFLQRYEDLILEVKRNGRNKALLYGIFYAVAQSVIFFGYAATFAYGSVLVSQGEMEFFEVFRVFSAIIFGGMMIGRQSAYNMDYTKARSAADRLFDVIDRVPLIDSTSPTGQKLKSISGDVEVKGVKFNYPSRPEALVLDELSLTVKPGETIALVGHSGCGKSTTVQLIQRFYDPVSGCLTFDGVDIKDLNIQYLRSQIGIVSQEPLLFDTTIRENIAYGDNSREVSMDEIITAARNANIHSFIESLPLGYETNAGDKGTQLSGGQKQRVAIARALIRNPKILLLDEATSALDTQSEQIVQDALDKARTGRTCIVIAHRLSTIQSADKIIVLNYGKVQEIGTHVELMERKGAYYKLHQAQNRRKKS